MAKILTNACTGGDIPHHDCTITGTGDEMITKELDAIDRTTVTLDDAYKSTCIEIPYPDGGILGCAYNVLVVVANVKHAAGMSLKNQSQHST